MLTFVSQATLLATLAFAPHIQDPAPDFALLNIVTGTESLGEAAAILALDVRVESAPTPVIDSAGDKLIIVADGTSTLADLVEAYAELAGIRMLAGASSVQALESKRFKMFGAPRGLTAEQLTPFVEGVLRDSGFILSANGGDKSYTIHSLEAWRGRAVNAMRVASDDLTLLRQHPALVMETVFAFKNADSRQLSTSLRPLFQEPAYQSIMGAGQSGALILRGTGLELANTIELLTTIDAAAAHADEQHAAIEQRQTQVAPPAPAAATQAIATERPKIVTRLFQIEGEIRMISDTAEGLTRGRFEVESAGQVWSSADGAQNSWPKPRFWTDRETQRVLVQAPERDFPGIETDLKTALKLHAAAN